MLSSGNALFSQDEAATCLLFYSVDCMYTSSPIAIDYRTIRPRAWLDLNVVPCGTFQMQHQPARSGAV